MIFTELYPLTVAVLAIPKGYVSDFIELKMGDNCPKDCPFDGQKCVCPAGFCDIDPKTDVNLCGGETVVVTATGLSEEEIKKYLSNEFFKEFNLVPFEMWVSQYSIHN